MNAATISTVVIACLALIAALGGGISWFYRRGRDEQRLSNSVDRMNETGKLQVKATEDLAAQVGGLRDTLERHSETLVEHHWRIKALESRTVEVKVQ